MIVVVIAVRITSHFVKDHVGGVFYHVGGVCDLRMITVGKLSQGTFKHDHSMLTYSVAL